MRFLADHMLGTLAKWLRFLGFYTLYPKVLGDKELINLAKDKNCTILTRDKDLSRTNTNIFYVESDKLSEQINQVIKNFELVIERPLSRCSICNTRLVTINKNLVRERVPERVYQYHNEFWECPNCKKIYWKGSHWEKMMETLREIKKEETI